MLLLARPRRRCITRAPVRARACALVLVTCGDRNEDRGLRSWRKKIKVAHPPIRGLAKATRFAQYTTFDTIDESLHRVVHRALRCRRRHLEWSAQHRSCTSIAEDAHGKAEAEENAETEERTEGFGDPFHLLDGLGDPVRRWR